MIISAGFIGGSRVIAAGFVEYTTAGLFSITTLTIPSGVTRVRVHLIGSGGVAAYSAAGYPANGNSSTFSAAGVSVIATGGTASGGYSGSNGGSVSAVAGVVGQGIGATNPGTGNTVGNNGTMGIDVGIGIGGGSGGWGTEYVSTGGLGGVGMEAGATFSPVGVAGGNGGGYNSTETLPIYGLKGGWAGVIQSGGYYANEGGAGGGYAMFYAPLIGGTAYANAIGVGSMARTNPLGRPCTGYCRIEWGGEI